MGCPTACRPTVQGPVALPRPPKWCDLPQSPPFARAVSHGPYFRAASLPHCLARVLSSCLGSTSAGGPRPPHFGAKMDPKVPLLAATSTRHAGLHKPAMASERGNAKLLRACCDDLCAWMGSLACFRAFFQALGALLAGSDMSLRACFATLGPWELAAMIGVLGLAGVH